MPVSDRCDHITQRSLCVPNHRQPLLVFSAFLLSIFFLLCVLLSFQLLAWHPFFLFATRTPTHARELNPRREFVLACLATSTVNRDRPLDVTSCHVMSAIALLSCTRFFSVRPNVSFHIVISCHVMLHILPRLCYAVLCSLPLPELGDQRGKRSLQAQIRRSGAHPTRAVKSKERRCCCCRSCCRKRQSDLGD